MIFLSRKNGQETVSIRHQNDGAVAREVAPSDLGDYFSWGLRDGRDLILTIKSNFYFLDGDKAILPINRVPSCDGIGVGARPLLSKDGQRITTFVDGTIVVRNLINCDDIVRTGIRGAKADFSWDGRYIAFHAAKQEGQGYEIQVVDLREKTLRTITRLPGSSLFPSWTRDGRLLFYYEDDQYRGFVMATDVLKTPTRNLTTTTGKFEAVATRWSAIFPNTPVPRNGITLVIIWAPWNAHSPDALRALQQVAQSCQGKTDVQAAIAVDPNSRRTDAVKMLERYRIELPEISIEPDRLTVTGAQNQVPALLMFRDGRLVDRRLGAQSTDELRQWVSMENSVTSCSSAGD